MVGETVEAKRQQTQSEHDSLVERAKRLIEAGGQIDLIDVRTPLEFREVHAVSARNVPLSDIDPQETQESQVP